MTPLPFTCAEIDEYVGPRCPEHEPGCPTCDFYEAWDTHAYGAIQNDIEALRAFCEE
jgi:hypothetical protein